MVTPLRGRDELDLPGLERLIEHILSGGVNGLFILGTTGEGPSLSYQLRRDLIQRVCQQVNNRVPILVGITDTAFVESFNIAHSAADSGASAVVLAPPYYLPEAQPELHEYLEHLVPELPLPLYIYNMPALTKVHFELDTVRRAMDEPRIIAGRLRKKFGLDVIVPDAQGRETIDSVIQTELVKGLIREESRARYRAVMADLVQQGCQAIILGCTEIPLLVTEADAAVPLFDTMRLHAAAIVDFALA